jgi:hypothetical protein
MGEFVGGHANSLVRQCQLGIIYGRQHAGLVVLVVVYIRL